MTFKTTLSLAVGVNIEYAIRNFISIAHVLFPLDKIDSVGSAENKNFPCVFVCKVQGVKTVIFVLGYIKS